MSPDFMWHHSMFLVPMTLKSLVYSISSRIFVVSGKTYWLILSELVHPVSTAGPHLQNCILYAAR